MGLSFQEEYPDFRNIREIDAIADLNQYGLEFNVYHAWVSAA